jgi:hypothetical protein
VTPPRFRKAAREQYAALLKTSKQAKKVGREWVAALEAYQRAANDAEPVPGLPRLAPFESTNLWLGNHTQNVRTQQQAVQRYVTEVTALVKGFEQIARDFVDVFVEREELSKLPYAGQKRGRQEKKRFNTAIIGLEDMFLTDKDATMRGSQILSRGC